MSTNPPLSQRVAIILGQSDPRTLYKLRPLHPSLYAQDLLQLQLHPPSKQQKPFVFVWEGEKYPLINEQVALLKILFASQDQAAKDEFPSLLLSQLNVRNAKIVAHVLVEIRRLDAATNMLPSTPGTLITPRAGLVFDGELLTEFWSGLRLKLALEAELFTDGDLLTIESTATGLVEAMPKKYIGPQGLWVPMQVGHHALREELEAVQGTVNRVRYLRLREQLLAAENPEINTDRQTVISRVQALGFPDDVVTVLDELERKIRGAATATVFKECMDLVRSVFERIVVESAARVAITNGDPTPTGGPFQPHKQYLQSNGVLSEKESDLFQKFYNYLSTEGAHALASAPEQARVAKNTAIELALMLLGRVQAAV
jgi:hypothetical protein